MNPLVVIGLKGASTALNPRLLADNIGVYVENAELGNDELKPLLDRLTVATVPTGTQQLSIYRFGRDTPMDNNYWFSWPTVVNVIRGLDPADTTERTYYTGSGSPKWTNNVIGLSGGAPYPQGVRELSVPAPISQPITTLTTDGTGDAGERFYVTTFVNDLGWESAPSPPSTGLTVQPGGSVVHISSLEAAPAGNYGITRRRIYVTQPGTTDGAANFYFLVELGISTTTFDDVEQTRQEVIPTIGANPPPADAFGITGLWNGMVAMISGKTILFSEPYQPYNVPVKYDEQVRDTPVALATWEQNLLVLTTGRSVMYQGSDPSGMSEVGSYSGQSCASARSVVSFGHGVVWASNEGLAHSSQGEVITIGLFTPKQWRALNPSTFVAGRYGRLYVASYTVGGVKKGLMIDPLRPQDGFVALSTGFDACWYDELQDALYVLEGGNVRKFDAATGTNLTVLGRSKEFRQLAPRNFGYAKVVATGYPVTLKVWSEFVDPGTLVRTMVLRITKTVVNDQVFSLPSGFQSLDWQTEASGAYEIQAVHLATDPRDLRGS